MELEAQYQLLREEMVYRQIAGRGVSDVAVLQSMRTVPRHKFVPADQLVNAYIDSPLPIGYKQTISQPFMVALMAEAALIQAGEKVLEIGTGCGYSAAVLAQLAGQLYTAEIVTDLGNSAKKRLITELGYKNIEVLVEDGSAGFAQFAPFDAIVVTAGAPAVPPSLQTQLAIGGRMIIPVRRGNIEHELLLRITRISEQEFREEVLEEVRFVPLLGKEGWQ